MLKRAEYHLRLGNDQQARADIEQARQLGAAQERCKWLAEQMKLAAEQRFAQTSGGPGFAK